MLLKLMSFALVNMILLNFWQDHIIQRLKAEATTISLLEVLS
jgi:hypothetical protein